MLVAVYGSLKKGRYNHGMLKDSKFIGDTEVIGTLYKVSSYPVLLDGDTEYAAEVYEVEDDVYEPIESMELGAGYEVRKMDTEYGEAVCFYGEPDVWDERVAKGYITKISEY